MSGNDFQARAASLEDAREVIRLAGLMYESMGVDASGDLWRQAASDAFVSRLGKDLVVFVINDPDNPTHLVAAGAGTIAVRLPSPTNPSARAGYLQWVSTEPNWRRRGFARKITKSLLAWYEECGVTSIELHATAQAEALYRSVGFEEGLNQPLRRRQR